MLNKFLYLSVFITTTIGASMQKQEMPLDCTGLLPEIQKIVADYLDCWESNKTLNIKPNLSEKCWKIIQKNASEQSCYQGEISYDLSKINLNDKEKLKKVLNLIKDHVEKALKTCFLNFNYNEKDNTLSALSIDKTPSRSNRKYPVKFRLELSPNNRYLIFHIQGHLFIIDLIKNYEIKLILFCYSDSYKISPNEKYITILENDSFKLLNLKDNKETVLPGASTDYRPNGMCFSKDSSYFAKIENCEKSEVIKVWRNQANELMQPISNIKNEIEELIKLLEQ